MLVLYPEDKDSRILPNFRLNKTACYISDTDNLCRHAQDDLKPLKSQIWSQKFTYIQDKELKAFFPMCDSEGASVKEYCITIWFWKWWKM